MERKDIIPMRAKELKRYLILVKVMEKRLTQIEAGDILGISPRQIRRLVEKVRQKGPQGLLHGSRGRRSPRKISEKRKERILGFYQRHYFGFGPTLAAEKLDEREGMRISHETLRQWLLEKGWWQKRKKSRQHRSWRERKACCGQMVQMDGRHHDWLEGRGPRLVLMAYIDDATNRVYAQFYDYEGTLPAMDSLSRYIELYGLPQSLYLDRNDTYKSPKPLTLEEELEGKEASQSQFQRAVEELGVSLIYAFSPQAKGRIERLFKTFQDRLIKEMRLEKISSREQANQFLEDYVPRYNQHFGRVAANPIDVHRPLPKKIEIRKILCIQESRGVRPDGTVRYQGRWYQIRDGLRPKTLQVQEWIDGSLHLVYQQKEIAFQEIFPAPKAHPTSPTPALRIRCMSPPAPTHPWRQTLRAKTKIKSVSPL